MGEYGAMTPKEQELSEEVIGECSYCGSRKRTHLCKDEISRLRSEKQAAVEQVEVLREALKSPCVCGFDGDDLPHKFLCHQARVIASFDSSSPKRPAR